MSQTRAWLQAQGLPSQRRIAQLKPALTITKCNHHGMPLLSYPGTLVYADDQLVIARCIWDMPKTYQQGAFSITQGDTLIELYYWRRWFNIFTVYDRGGGLKGWYCNITRPLVVEQNELRWRDLALDLLVMPDGQSQVLDQDEYEALDLSSPDRANAERDLARLQQWAGQRRWPLRASPACLNNAPRTIR